MPGLEIVGQAKEQSAVFRLDRFPLNDLPDRTAAQPAFLPAIGISDPIVAKKKLLTDQFDIVEAVIGTTFLDHFRNQVEDKRGMDAETLAVTDASIEKYAFS